MLGLNIVFEDFFNRPEKGGLRNEWALPVSRDLMNALFTAYLGFTGLLRVLHRPAG
jgi:hypothetical protein